MEHNYATWMIGGGFRDDPAEHRNRALLRALRERQAEGRLSLADRLRMLVTGVAPERPAAIDQICCSA